MYSPAILSYISAFGGFWWCECAGCHGVYGNSVALRWWSRFYQLSARHGLGAEKFWRRERPWCACAILRLIASTVSSHSYAQRVRQILQPSSYPSAILQSFSGFLQSCSIMLSIAMTVRFSGFCALQTVSISLDLTSFASEYWLVVRTSRDISDASSVECWSFPLFSSLISPARDLEKFAEWWVERHGQQWIAPSALWGWQPK